MARSAAARIASCSWYSGSSRPGESVKMYCVSSFVSRPTTGSRVDCGLGDTIARCSPTNALSSVDLPTLGLPARTMVPQRVIRRSVDQGGSLRELGDCNQAVFGAQLGMMMTKRSLLFATLALVSPTLAGGQVVQSVHGDV